MVSDGNHIHPNQITEKNAIMKTALVSFIIITTIFVSCGPSDESKKEAADVYRQTISILSPVTDADSVYAACMQYLMNEVQKPSIKKDKKKMTHVRDSIEMLSDLGDSLSSRIAQAESKIKSLKKTHEQFSLFASTDSLLQRYKEVTGKIYPQINSSFSGISLPVKDSEYTIILQLTYQADSILNAAVQRFNTESAAFKDEYSIEAEKKPDSE